MNTEERERRPDSSAAQASAVCIICRTPIASAAEIVVASAGAMQVRCKGEPDAGTRARASDIASWWGPDDKRAA
jgi:hypothetical protein